MLCRAEPEQQDSESDLQKKFFSSPAEQRRQQPGSGSSSSDQQKQQNIIDNVNPYELGRQARRAFDDVWGQISSLTTPTKSYVFDDILDPSLSLEEEGNESDTTVLVVGATGRVGRILIRKLLLRGYKVKALIRLREGVRESKEDIQGLPSAVEVITGDVGELRYCQKALKGVDKVIFCAAARSTFTGDLNRVDAGGVSNISTSLQDELFRRAKGSGAKYSPAAKKEVADFGRVYHQLRWDVQFVGVMNEDGTVRQDAQRSNLATAEITEANNLVFAGALFNRGAFAEVGAELDPLLPGGDERLRDTEGLTLRVRAEGHVYACVLRTREGFRYVARFPTRINGRYCTVRLPWALFRAEAEGSPVLEPAAVTHIGLRYELRRTPQAPGVSGGAQQQQQPQPALAAAPAAAAQQGPSQPGLFVPEGARLPAGASATMRARSVQLQQQRAAQAEQRFQRFKIEVDWIKALPAGVEPDFVLVSCAGSATRPGVELDDLNRIVAAKRKGEEALRASGLGYTIIRPGPLVDEPGGYKALVFDQGDRVGQSVSAADVADICLRALHEPEARNKTFDVCYEFQSDEGLQLYELVASIPSKGGNYLAQALSTLQRNT